MKALTIITILLTVVTASSYFQFEQPLKTNIDGIEKQFKSKQFKLKSKIYVSDDFFPDAGSFDLEQPLVYIRMDKEFHVQPEVKYYFTPDDTIRLISHSWDTKSVSKNLNYNEDFSKSKEQDINQWNAKFDQLQGQISTSLGASIEGNGELETKSRSGYGDWKERNIKWKSNGCTTELKMVWTEQDIQLSGGPRLVPTFRIRTKTYWN
jgi:hypothetical protein|tara:strand:- start:53 stop:676 length:624 start_codon:yes stop_codon:yes gene_type:complete